MRQILPLLFVGLALPVTCVGQVGCPGGTLPGSRDAIEIRHQLHGVAVPERDPQVPAPVAAQLLRLKAALTQVSDAAFACASPSTEPEDLQKTLADTLHANRSGAGETTYVTRTHKDLGAYGSDLAVQVLPLFNSPRYYEVDFRYGVECGDDNLLLVYQAGAGAAGSQWGRVLSWGAPAYNTVADAFGDFVLLTPLSGFPGQRNWRFVVAHGQPECRSTAAPGHFDLDLLEPTGDPSRPTVAWHMEQPYLRFQVPRLSTTEDTLTFELRTPEVRTARGTRPPGTSAAESFRFHVTRDNKVEPLRAATDAGTSPAAQAANTSSPQ